jgi:hypothetical protein
MTVLALDRTVLMVHAAVVPGRLHAIVSAQRLATAATSESFAILSGANFPRIGWFGITVLPVGLPDVSRFACQICLRPEGNALTRRLA